MRLHRGDAFGLRFCIWTRQQVRMRVRCACVRLIERPVRVGLCFWPRQAQDLNFEIEKLEVQINNLNVDRYVCVASMCLMTASPFSGFCFCATIRTFDRHGDAPRLLCARAFLREEVAEAKLYTVKLQVFRRLFCFTRQPSYCIARAC